MNRCECQFWLRVREIVVAGQYTNLPADGLANWMPPDSHADFGITADTGLQRWTHGALSPESDPPRSLEQCEVTSMFWCPHRRQFLQAPFDCTLENAEDRDGAFGHRWAGLTFERPGRSESCNSEYPQMWRVGYRLQQVQMPGPHTRSWDDLFGPSYFDNQANAIYGITQSRPPPCQLAGSLSILSGLIAYTVTWDNISEMFEQCFHPFHNDNLYRPPWTLNLPRGNKLSDFISVLQAENLANTTSGRRGLVIQVLHDPARHDVRGWRLGERGPILVCNN